MRAILIFIAFFFNSLFAMDCNSMSSVKLFNGHYYAKTNNRASYDTIRVSAMNDNGYLAIPNSAEENDFIKSLIGGNTEAWIGVFDPNHAKNYCYDNATCLSDDTRFRDVKGQTLLYKKWASSEPNNFVELTDMENSIAVVDPLGENWVVMSGNTGEWHDVGNHKNSNQNPRKNVAIVEFNEKPICYLGDDAVTDTNFPERVCNTQVFDDNIANADKGTTTKCLFDINGKEYCPQGLADATSYWSYIAGDSFKNITSVTDYAQGEYKEYTDNVRDFMDGFATVHNNTVVDYQTGSGTRNVGTVVDYQSNSTATVHGGNVIDYTKYITEYTIPAAEEQNCTNYNVGCNPSDGAWPNANRGTPLQTVSYPVQVYESGTFKGQLNSYSEVTKTYNSCDGWGFKTASFSVGCFSGKCDRGRIFGFCEKKTCSPVAVTTYGGVGCENGCTSYYCSNSDAVSCPNGYYATTLSNGKIGCAKSSCPSGYSGNGTNCQKLVNYNMYSYQCPNGYTPINNGFSSFTKSDPDTLNINDYSLDDDVNSSIAPASNCRKAITYSYYNYSCPVGYTINDGGLTSACPKADPNSTTYDEATLSQACNNGIPPAGNCTKIIPYTFYSYECSNGYTAIDGGLSSCNKVDASNASDTSSSLSKSCNSETPPASNCFKDIAYKYYTYSCPAGYSIANYGLTSCPKKDPNNTINNENELDDNCNNPTPPVGNCSKSIDYAYYQYVCTGGTNNFNEPYAAVDSGLNSCSKSDTDLINTNPDLANSCNSATPPDNNCKTTSYTCNSEIREPVWIDNKWQCSPFPCYGNNNIEDLSKNVGSLDKDDNGWTEQGKCQGKIYIFSGKAQQCRSSDKFFGLAGGGCCKDDKYAMGLMSCNADEKELQIKKENKRCHYVGEYCSKKMSLGFAKICIRTSKSYCCFNSTLARIIGEQGREQLTDIDWGNPENPNCRGFTIEEFQRLDLGKMDLTEFTDSIKLPDITNKQEAIIQKINNHINLIQ